MVTCVCVLSEHFDIFAHFVTNYCISESFCQTLNCFYDDPSVKKTAAHILFLVCKDTYLSTSPDERQVFIQGWHPSQFKRKHQIQLNCRSSTTYVGWKLESSFSDENLVIGLFFLYISRISNLLASDATSRCYPLSPPDFV